MADILVQIRAELDLTTRQRDRAASEVVRLDAKLTELEAALRVVERLTGATAPAPSGSIVSENRTITVLRQLAARRSQARGVKKELINEALDPSVGRTVSDIKAWILDHHGLDVSPNTISVTLPRLRSDGLARLEGHHWFRALQGMETAGHPAKDDPAVPSLQAEEVKTGPP
jgi:hypothetical protein